MLGLQSDRSTPSVHMPANARAVSAVTTTVSRAICTSYSDTRSSDASPLTLKYEREAHVANAHKEHVGTERQDLDHVSAR